MGKNEKPQVHIGVIGTVDHNKRTLTEAIRITLEEMEHNKVNKQHEEKEDNKVKIEIGGLGMSKRDGNYVGSTVLGYRLVVDRAGSKRNKYIKKSKTLADNRVKGKTKMIKRNFLGK